MRVKKLRLNQFRNYAELFLEFPKSLNIFVGENAQGKTNLLEAIYFLALGRSYRTSRDAELVQWEAAEALVQAEIERELASVRIEVRLQRDGGKEIRVGHETLRRHGDLFGHVNVVVFSPDDLQLVKGPPALRRRFLDLEIAQVSAAYRHHFARYQRVLRQRNNLLKAVQGGQAPPDMLEAWDPQLVADGARIVAKRAEALRRLSAWSEETHRTISGGREALRLVYVPFFSEGESPKPWWEDPAAVEERFWDALRKVRKEEIIRGVTLVGPQRDDIAFMAGEVDLRLYGSQGQQRTSVLSCKLAELEFMREEAGEYPILLLDDVMSELDDSRRARFLRTVTGRVNTFITTTNLRSFTPDVMAEAATYRIRAGTVAEEG